MLNVMWRTRVSIPVPQRCERCALPIELVPLFFYIYACACACAYDENIKNMLHPRRLGLGCSSLAMRTRLEFLTRFDKSDPYADRMRFIG